jgi:hypothetical protein
MMICVEYMHSKVYALSNLFEGTPILKTRSAFEIDSEQLHDENDQ